MSLVRDDVPLQVAIHVPDLDLVTVVASTEAAGAAGPELYLDLVSSYIAPALGQ